MSSWEQWQIGHVLQSRVDQILSRIPGNEHFWGFENRVCWESSELSFQLLEYLQDSPFGTHPEMPELILKV